MPTGLPRLVLLLGILLAGVDATAAQDEAQRWLTRMQTALADLDYRGRFSYFRDGQLSSLAIQRARIDGVQRERLVHLDGPPREILREGDRVVCMLRPGDPMLDFAERIPPGGFARAFIPGDRGAHRDVVPPTYRAGVVGQGRIAGHRAIRIDIRPDDDSRYGYRLWLHDESAMPLRAELTAIDARPLEIFQFVDIDIGAAMHAKDLAPAVSGELVRHELTFEARTDSPEVVTDWEAAWLPRGFRMAAAAQRHMPDRSSPVDTLRFSDGLATLSIFVEPARVQAAWSERRSTGATSAVMRELETTAGDRYLVTVVGEVPMATAERVAAAVRPKS